MNDFALSKQYNMDILTTVICELIYQALHAGFTKFALNNDKNSIVLLTKVTIRLGCWDVNLRK